MRLKSVEIDAFRAFNVARRLDFDADVVLLFGRNGFGKSTVFDAISWCLFGSCKRFSGSRDFSRADSNYLTNTFRKSGEERVRVELGNRVGSLVVERVGSALSVQEGQTARVGPAAQTLILEHLGFRAKPNESRGDLLKRGLDSFTRSSLLHQALLGNFVTAESPRNRFDAFAELFSLTPVREFYGHLQLEMGRAQQLYEQAISRERIEGASHVRMREQLLIEQSEIQRLAQVAPSRRRTEIEQLVEALLSDVRSLAHDVVPSTSDVDNIDAALVAVQRGLTNQGQETKRLLSLQARLPLVASWRKEERVLGSRLHETRREVTSKEVEINTINSAIDRNETHLRRQEGEIHRIESARKEIDSLLGDALRFVSGERCPVCEQPIDSRNLTRRLRSRLRKQDPALPLAMERRNSLNAELQELRRNLSAHNVELRSLRIQASELEGQRRDLVREIERVTAEYQERFGMAVPRRAPERVVDARLAVLEGTRTKLESLLLQLEEVRPAVDLAERRRRVPSLRTEMQEQSQVVASWSEQAIALGRVRDLLGRLVHASRRGERAIVERFLDNFRKPIQETYRWISPHPVFTSIDIRVDSLREAGELYFVVTDGERELNPSATFSSGQANALALAIFLVLNAAPPRSAMDFAMIDDPIQSMDDSNVLSLTDLLRRSAEQRQLALSTSVSHLSRLLTDKLRPRDVSQRLLVHNFIGYGKLGPEIETSSVSHREGLPVLPKLLNLVA